MSMSPNNRSNAHTSLVSPSPTALCPPNTVSHKHNPLSPPPSPEEPPPGPSRDVEVCDDDEEEAALLPVGKGDVV